MAMERIATSYGSSKGVLAFPDHYIAVPIFHAKAVLGTVGISTLTAEGRYIVKAGTFYPTNDTNAQGVIMNDVDVTDGDGNLAMIIHGFISMAKLPLAPVAAAIAALPMIKFVPVVAFVAPVITTTLLLIATDDADVYTQVISIANATFRPEANDLANWTITGESVNKAVYSAPVVSADFKSVSFTVTTSTAVNGSNTILAEALAVSINTDTAAITSCTVATP